VKYYSSSKKAFFDDAIEYNTLPDDIISVTDQQYFELLDAINNKGKQIVVSDGAIALSDRIFNDTWNNIRYVRNRRLKASDYTQLSDFNGDSTAWATYREALRDLPQTYANVEDVIWPVPPGE
jgi:hypothetical protein